METLKACSGELLSDVVAELQRRSVAPPFGREAVERALLTVAGEQFEAVAGAEDGRWEVVVRFVCRRLKER